MTTDESHRRVVGGAHVVRHVDPVWPLVVGVEAGLREQRLEVAPPLCGSPEGLPLAVVVVLAAANTIEAIRPAYPELLAVLARLRPREFAKLSVP